MDDYKIEERQIDNNNIQEPIITNEQKELTYTPSLYKRISDKYYALVDKLHLRPITDKIDKVMPSMIFFVLLALIIIVLIIYFIVAGLGPSLNEYSLSFTLNGKAYSGDYLVSLSGNDSIQLITPSKAKGETKFLCSENVSVNAKITINGQTHNKSFKTDKDKISFDIVTNVSVDNSSEKKKENIFSFALVTPNGSLDKSGIIKAICDDFSQEYNFSNGLLNNIKMPCKTISVNVNVEGIPPVSQMCNPGLCKINMSDNLSTTKIDQIVPTNKLVIYVNNKDGSSAVGINVEILEDSVGQELVDNGKTKDFGSYNVDLIAGDYIVNISDPSGKFASQQKKVKVTAGNLEPLIFVLDVPAIGNILVNFNVEDSNVLSGTIFLKDENQNILQTKPFDSNVNVSFPMSVNGNYNISTKLNNQYISDYITQDISVIYDLESGDKTVENVIRKMNPFLDQNIIIQVTELQTGKPIPFAKIYFKNLSKQNEFLTNVGFVNTDSNGVYSLILPVGQYSVFLDHFSLGGKAAFSVIETKSLTLTSQFINLKVDWGNSKINVCLFEGKKPLDDAFIEVYSVERGLELTFYVDKNINCASTEVKKLENIYLHVIKSGYFDLYSQTIFMNNDASKDKPKELNLNLSQIVPVNPIIDLESEFLGIYNDDGLISSANKITGPTDTSNGEYYYAFKVKLPKAKALQNRTINFYGLAGDKKDENVELSKMIAEYISSIGQSKLYSNYNPEFNEYVLKLAEIGENNKYKAKTFLSNYTFTNDSTNDLEIIYTVLVRVTNNIIETEMGDNLFFWYDFKLDNDKPNLKSILKKIGTQKCINPICVDAYINGYQLDSSSKVPAKGNIYGKIFFSNSDEKSLIIYNKNEDGADKKEDIKDIFIVLDKNNSFILPVNIFGDYSFSNLETGPIYFDNLINAESADFNLNYELISSDNSAIIFRPYYNGVWDKNNDPVSININIEETEQLIIAGIPEFIVPFVSNSFLLTVKQNDDSPAVGAEVKYYVKKSGESWRLIENYNTNNLGQVKIDTVSLGIDDETKILVYFQGYKPSIYEINSNFDFFDIKKDLSATVNYPVDLENTEKQLDINNESNYDLNIFNLHYYLNETSGTYDIANSLLKKDVMENKFKEGYILHGNNLLKIGINYDMNMLINLSDNINIPVVMNFNYIPSNSDNSLINTLLNNLDVKLNKNLPLNLYFKFDGSPDNDCLLFSFYKDSLEIDNLVFVDSKENNFELRILNNCTSQGFSNYKFKNVSLNLESKLPSTITISKEGSQVYAGVPNINVDIPLDDVKISNVQEYRYNVNIIVNDFNDLAMSDNPTIPLEFTITGSYVVNGLEDKSQMNSKSINLLFITFEKCLEFKLDEDNVSLYGGSVDLYKLKVNDELTDILRMPYYLDGELDNRTKNIVHSTNGGKDLAGDISLDGFDVYNSKYSIDSLPLIIKNNCGKELTMRVCNETDKYCSYNVGNNKFNFEVAGSKLTFNEEFDLSPNESKKFTLRRPDNFSGAAVLPLYLKSNEKFLEFKKLKINIESSINNNYFLTNPFIIKPDDKELSYLVYMNEYYPTGFDTIIKDLAGQTYLGWGGGQMNFEVEDYNTRITNYISNRSDFKNSSIFKNYKSNDFTLFVNKEEFYTEESVGDDDEGAGFRYGIYNKDLSSIYDFSEAAEAISKTDISDDFIGEDNYQNPYAYTKLLDYAKIVGTSLTNDVDYPYFINVGNAFVEGDSGDSTYVSAITYCPDNFDPLKIYLDYYHEDLDDFTHEFYFKEDFGDSGFDAYLYGGFISLDDDGLNDNAYANYRIITICRLKKEYFPYDVPRQIIKYREYDDQVIISDNDELSDIVKKELSNIVPTDLLTFDEQQAYSTLSNRLNELYDYFIDNNYQVYFACDYLDKSGNKSTCVPSMSIKKDGQNIDVNDLIALEFSNLISDNFVESKINDAFGNDSSYNYYSCHDGILRRAHDEDSEKKERYSTFFMNNLNENYKSKYNYYNEYFNYVKSELKTKILDNNLAVSILSFSDYIKQQYGFTLTCSNCSVNNDFISNESSNIFGLLRESQKSIRIYKEPLTNNNFNLPEVTNCFAGGLTGFGAKPKIDFTNNNIDLNCESKEYACDLPQFVNYIKMQSVDKDIIQFKANLLYDNYTKEAFDIYQQRGFLQNKDLNISFLTYNEKPVGILTTGAYNVKAIKDSYNNYRVYIAYDSYLLPDHLFYYMPITTPDFGIGTTTNLILNYSNTKSYSLQTDIASLFKYNLNDYIYNIDNLPIVLSGMINFTDNGGGSGEISFLPNDLIIESLKNQDITRTIDGKISYANIIVKKNGQYYSGNMYYDLKINILDNKANIDLKLKENLDYIGVEPYLVYVISKESNITNSDISVTSIQDISNEINNENICYLNKNGKFLYYWNIFKILGQKS